MMNDETKMTAIDRDDLILALRDYSDLGYSFDNISVLAGALENAGYDNDAIKVEEWRDKIESLIGEVYLFVTEFEVPVLEDES